MKLVILTQLQVLSKEDTQTLNLCKNMMGRGEWPPLMVVFDSLEGWVLARIWLCFLRKQHMQPCFTFWNFNIIWRYDDLNRFTVEADRFIRDLTIITEYVGDVDYLKNRENDDGDSMMTLLSAADPSKSLVICPDKHSNIARFINGINNHTQYVRSLIWLAFPTFLEFILSAIRSSKISGNLIIIN